MEKNFGCNIRESLQTKMVPIELYGSFFGLEDE